MTLKVYRQRTLECGASSQGIPAPNLDLAWCHRRLGLVGHRLGFGLEGLVYTTARPYAVVKVVNLR